MTTIRRTPLTAKRSFQDVGGAVERRTLSAVPRDEDRATSGEALAEPSVFVAISRPPKCSRTGPSRPADRFRVREHGHASSCEGIRKASRGGKGRARSAAFDANAPPSLTLNAARPQCNPIRPPEEWVTYRIRKRRGKAVALRGTYPGFPLGGFGNGCGIPRPLCPPGAGGGSGSGAAGSTSRPPLSPAG